MLRLPFHSPWDKYNNKTISGFTSAIIKKSYAQVDKKVETVYGDKNHTLNKRKQMMQMNSHKYFGQIYVAHDKSSEYYAYYYLLYDKYKKCKNFRK